MAGRLELPRARVSWFLSVDGRDLPEAARAKGQPAHRSLAIDGQEVEFSEGFTDLHTRVYADILAGGGFGIREAREAIRVVHAIRTADVVAAGKGGHPLLRG
jgi:UDP-N-acetyl-2-amino-2-deoxyglucuronate dehydrogenase